MQKNGPVPYETQKRFLPESNLIPPICTLSYQSFGQLWCFKSEAFTFVLASDIHVWAELLTVMVAKSIKIAVIVCNVTDPGGAL